MCNITKLLIRHEDSLHVLLSERQYLLHLGAGPAGILPSLLQETTAWRKSEKSTPLRHRLVVTMFSLLMERLNTLMQAQPTSEPYQRARDYQILDKNGEMPFLMWDVTKKQLQPIPTKEVHKMLTEIIGIVQDPTTTLRFHSLKKVKQDSPGMETVP